MEKDLLFYNEYEQFYLMARKSEVFRLFCEKAFGMDFSQDGFSDISQTDRILQYIPKNEKAYILDIGCGNGKMLGYLQKRQIVLYMDLIIQKMLSKLLKNYLVLIVNLYRAV